MIDENGYRANVGIILVNEQKRLFWGRRTGGLNAWQFPQGGIQRDESVEDAMYRELWEEVGLKPQDVEIVAKSAGWLTYQLPRRLIRHHTKPVCIGQKQKWFLLKIISSSDNIDLLASGNPEFDDWCWVSYWYPLKEVVSFKRKVYRDVLQEFVPFVFPDKRLRNPKQNLRSALRPRRKDTRVDDTFVSDDEIDNGFPNNE